MKLCRIGLHRLKEKPDYPFIRQCKDCNQGVTIYDELF